MSEKIELDVDTTEAERKIDELDSKIENTEAKVKKATSEVERSTKESFNKVKGMMRASYMMVAGITRVIGGDLGRVFSAMYGIGVAAIGMWRDIATTMAASGVGALQAALMFASLSSALGQLTAALTQNTELSQQMSGLTMSLHGFSGLLDSMNFS